MGLFGKGGIFGGGLLGGGLFGGGGGSLGKFIISESTIPSIDLPERVKERNRESSNPLVQTVQAIDDAREEAKEIMTDGVVEMVFKGNKETKTTRPLLKNVRRRTESYSRNAPSIIMPANR